MTNASTEMYDGEFLSMSIQPKLPVAKSRGKDVVVRAAEPKRPTSTGETLRFEPLLGGGSTLSNAAAQGASLLLTPKSPELAVVIIRLMQRLDGHLLSNIAEGRQKEFDETINAALRGIVPAQSDAEFRMATRVAKARAAMLAEFGYFTREQLASRSRAKNPAGIVDTWRKRNKVFAVNLPEAGPKDSDVYLKFQFHEGKPLPVVADVIDAFAGRRSGWSLAHWFVAGNGTLEGSSRPVDLLTTSPDAVVAAARFDASPSAA